MGIVSKKIAIVSGLVAMAAVVTPLAFGRLGTDRETESDQLMRGGWDGNGPDMSGVVGEDEDLRIAYRGSGGGWDANGPDAQGAQISEAGAAHRLDLLVLDAVELPDGEVVGVAKD